MLRSFLQLRSKLFHALSTCRNLRVSRGASASCRLRWSVQCRPLKTELRVVWGEPLLRACSRVTSLATYSNVRPLSLALKLSRRLPPIHVYPSEVRSAPSKPGGHSFCLIVVVVERPPSHVSARVGASVLACARVVSLRSAACEATGAECRFPCAPFVVGLLFLLSGQCRRPWTRHCRDPMRRATVMA